MIVPPSPRASAIVDPRIGDLGPALLALEDGTVFPGIAFGAPLAGGGDLVVNTSQTGYQEVCTDPSYAGQVVVMTYPLIGNYGRLIDDDQSAHPWLRALVVANATAAVLEDARQLAALLRDASIPAIAGVDTRALARHLRANGCLRGDRDGARRGGRGRGRAAARAVPRWEDQDFVGQVSPAAIMDIGDATEGGPLVGDRRLRAQVEHRPIDAPARCPRPRLPAHGRRVRRRSRPTSTGSILSPGPGDPARLEAQVALARAIIEDGRPLLGICLGHQIVGRAAGADTRGCGSGITGRTTRSRTWTSGSSR